MSIEAFLAINLASDFVLLAAISRAMGLFSWRRILLADLLCAAAGTLAVILPGWRLWVALACPALAAWVLVYRRAPRIWSVFTAALVVQALLCAGIARLLDVPKSWKPALCLGAGALLSTLVWAGHPPGCRNWQVQLCLARGGRHVRFPALIDTGNRLHEPLSGLPVLIAEESLVRHILPDRGYRTLAYGGVGGEGRMPCFRPDAVWVYRGLTRRPGPDIWVAVSPRPLPGLVQALAPPEFVLYRS